jgi:hypothetical protein
MKHPEVSSVLRNLLSQDRARTRQLPFLAIVMLLLAGCSRSPEQPAVPNAYAPVPVPPEVHAAAVQRGTAIVAEAFTLLSSNLQSAMRQGGVTNALPYCSLSASPLTAGLAEKHGVTIRRLTHKPRNSADRADASELAILDHFRSGLGATNPPLPLVTNLAAGRVAFFMPIVITNELCLKCHGELEKDIALEHLAVIRRLYPGDEATGFRLGDLRGAWRVDLPLGSQAIRDPQP